jgi:hypothetical protein
LFSAWFGLQVGCGVTTSNSGQNSDFFDLLLNKGGGGHSETGRSNQSPLTSGRLLNYTNSIGARGTKPNKI